MRAVDDAQFAHVNWENLNGLVLWSLVDMEARERWWWCEFEVVQHSTGRDHSVLGRV